MPYCKGITYKIAQQLRVYTMSLMNDQQVLIKVKEAALPWLVFEFQKHLDEKSADEAVQVWNQHFSNLQSGEKMGLVFDCRKMKNYDTNARLLWQKNMTEKKKQIGDIWIISESRLILAAAKTMGLLTGFKIRVAQNDVDVWDSIRKPVES